jgi:hypothetical protein
MSINAVVNGITYDNITAISAVGKTFVLTEAQDGDTSGIWDGADSESIRWLISSMKNAVKTGTFTPATLPTTLTQMFDTELGNDWSYIVIYDQTSDAWASTISTNIAFYVIKRIGTAVRCHHKNGYSSGIGTFSASDDAQIRISDGKVSMKTDYGDEQAQYSPVIEGHSYRWMAW